jgi:hypothetical protein
MPKPFAPPPLRPLLFLLLGLASGMPNTVQAQEPSPPYHIRWYQPVIVAAGVSVFFLIDNPTRTYMLDNQTQSKEDLASTLRLTGEPLIWAGVPAVMVGTGLVFGKPGLTRSGLRAVTSAALAGGVTYVLKWAFGRERPSWAPGCGWCGPPSSLYITLPASSDCGALPGRDTARAATP